MKDKWWNRTSDFLWASELDSVVWPFAASPQRLPSPHGINARILRSAGRLFQIYSTSPSQPSLLSSFCVGLSTTWTISPGAPRSLHFVPVLVVGFCPSPWWHPVPQEHCRSLKLSHLGLFKPSGFQKPFLVHSLVFYISFITFHVKPPWTPFQVFSRMGYKPWSVELCHKLRSLSWVLKDAAVAQVCDFCACPSQGLTLRDMNEAVRSRPTPGSCSAKVPWSPRGPQRSRNHLSD